MTPTKNRVWTHVLQKGKQFLLKMWHPPCSSSYKPDDKPSMGKGLDCNDDNLNVAVVICDKDTPCRLTKSQWRLHLNHYEPLIQLHAC
jgi:hypothetical protein